MWDAEVQDSTLTPSPSVFTHWSDTDLHGLYSKYNLIIHSIAGVNEKFNLGFKKVEIRPWWEVEGNKVFVTCQ